MDRYVFHLMIKYMKGQGNLSFLVGKKAQKGLTDAFCGCEKVEKLFWFSGLFTFYTLCIHAFTTVKRDAKF